MIYDGFKLKKINRLSLLLFLLLFLFLFLLIGLVADVCVHLGCLLF